MPISQEHANRGECDACGRIVWSIDFEPLPGVILNIRVSRYDGSGEDEVHAFSCLIDPAHTASAVGKVMNQFLPEDGSQPINPYTIEVKRHTETTPHGPVDVSATRKPAPILEQNFDSLVAAVPRGKRPPVRSDAQLRGQLSRVWVSEGAEPSVARTKKLLRVGDDRAKRLLDSLREEILTGSGADEAN